MDAQRNNRTLNEMFPNAHPSETAFIEKMEEHSREKAERQNLIRKGLVTPYELEEFNLPEIPLSYINFKVQKKVKITKKTAKRKRRN